MAPGSLRASCGANNPRCAFESLFSSFAYRYSLIGLLAYLLIGLFAHWLIGLFDYWLIVLLAYWHFRIQGSRKLAGKLRFKYLPLYVWILFGQFPSVGFLTVALIALPIPATTITPITPTFPESELQNVCGQVAAQIIPPCVFSYVWAICLSDGFLLVSFRVFPIQGLVSYCLTCLLAYWLIVVLDYRLLAYALY